ncbi:MAG: Dabb family protein [Candidatus Nanopelagicales bacterium]
MITHVVMWRFHDPADVDEAVVRLHALTGRVVGLTSLRVGRNQNTTPHAYELVLVSEHADDDALRAYIADPVHQEVVAWMADRVSARAVVDTGDLS